MLRHSLIVGTLLVVSYGTIFVCGIIGNTFIILSLFQNPRLRSTTNIFIGNLAVADLLISVFCVPFTLAANLLDEWRFGAILCKFVGYFEEVIVNASVINLVAISVDRCLSINRPFGFMRRKKNLIIVIILIWIFPSLYMVPWLLVFDAKSINGHKQHMICSDFWSSKEASDAYFVIVNLMFSYLLPLIIISVCYLRIYKKITSRHIPGEMCPVQRRQINYDSKIRIIKMILFVIIVFVLSWLPLYILIVAIKFFNYPKSKEQLKIFEILFPFAQWLATFNSCINPVIYTCYSRNFRIQFFKCLKQMHLLDTRKKHLNNMIYSATINDCILLSSSQIA